MDKKQKTLKDIDQELRDFIRWYWNEIDGKPYNTTSDEVVKWYTTDCDALKK